MGTAATPWRGYQLAPQELAGQVKALAALSDRTSGLVSSASQLAERLPQLGTSPPALHLAMRLREAAGESGLTGDIKAVDTNMNSFHRTLNETVTGYLDGEHDVAQTFRTIEGGTT